MDFFFFSKESYLRALSESLEITNFENSHFEPWLIPLLVRCDIHILGHSNYGG